MSSITTSVRELHAVEREASGCERCPLYRDATQTVFGEGPARAELMLVGEQPGDSEDRDGHPFVGPAGRLLDEALAQAGIDREQAWVTNTVKHFKFEQRGKRRIHQKPDAAEVAACRYWLDAELDLVQPRVLVALGATAARSLFGNDFRVTREHGRFEPGELAPFTGATVHPSAILRMRGEELRDAAFATMVKDLRAAAAKLR